jgi:hypothetical protein
MSDIDTTDAPAAASAASLPPAEPTAEAAAPRPAFIPEKFWDGAAGRIRIEELARSYRALERRLGRGGEPPTAAPVATPLLGAQDPAEVGPEPGSVARGMDPHSTESTETGGREEATASVPPDGDADGMDISVPATPEDYAVEVSHPWLERDAGIDGLLHAAGFNNAQAQLVYDLAAERVVPVIEAMAREYERRLGQSRLAAHFGGHERFEALARQVRAWGERHLPQPLFETLAATPDGIVALHHMMRAGEPRFLAGERAASGPSQSELETLVRDPRYWRDHEPDLVKRVEEGFRRLYPGD